MLIDNRLVWIGFFLVLFGIFTQAKIIERGQPDWRLPSFGNGKLYASDGTTIGIDPQANGCFIVYNNDSEPWMRRCWIFNGVVNGREYFLPSWQLDWSWRIFFQNQQRLVIEASTSIGNFDLNMYFDDKNGSRPHLLFVGKNGTPFPLEDLRVGYVFMPYDLNAINSNWADLFFNWDGNIFVTENIPRKLKIFNEPFTTKDLFRGGWTPNRLFVGRAGAFREGMNLDQPVFILEALHDDVPSGNLFRIGDIIERSGTFCDADWNAGDTIYISANATLEEDCQLTIHENVTVKYASETKISLSTAAGRTETIVAHGNSWDANQYIVFTSIDDDVIGETIPASDHIPTDGNYDYAISSGFEQQSIQFAEVRYADIGFNQIGQTGAGTAEWHDINNLRIVRAKTAGFGKATESDTISFHDLNISCYEACLWVGSVNNGSVYNSFFEGVSGDSIGIYVKLVSSFAQGNFSLHIENVFDNNFSNLNVGIQTNSEYTGGLFGHTHNNAIRNLYNNSFSDSNKAVYLYLKNGGDAILENFYSNFCENVGQCIDLNFSGTNLGGRWDTNIYRVFNNLFENSNGIRVNFFVESGMQTMHFPDINNNTFIGDSAIEYRLLENVREDWNGNIRNNIFANTTTPFTKIDSDGADYGGQATHNGFYNSDDINKAFFDVNRTAQSTPFDTGNNGNFYLNANPLGGKQFREKGFLTVDGNINERTARASNYQSDFFDSNRDLGFHYVVPDLNLRVDVNSLITDLNNFGLLTIDINTGSTTINTSKLWFDFNVSIETRQGYGKVLAQGIDTNHPQLYCNTETMNPITQCHFIFDSNTLDNQTVFFTSRVWTSVAHAFDASDRNFGVYNLGLDELWFPRPAKDYSFFWIVGIGIVLFFVFVGARR